MARILVVDDDRPVRHAILKALKAAGHDAIDAGTRLEAIQRARELRPAILLLDLKLGDNKQSDGLSLFKTIRGEHPGAAGIMMTGYGSEALALECGKAGMAGYLKKPFLPAAVVQAVTRVLEEAASGGDATMSPQRRSPEHRPQLVGALIDRLRPLEICDWEVDEIMRPLKTWIVDILANSAVEVPVLLTCGPSLDSAVQYVARADVRSAFFDDKGDARCAACQLATNLRRSLERVLAIAARPRAAEIDDALARIEAAARGGGLPSEGELARQVGRSRSQISRGIVDATGFPFLALARGYRLRPALPALLTSRQHLDQIALGARYDDVRQFRRDFRGVFGVSARRLRKGL